MTASLPAELTDARTLAFADVERDADADLLVVGTDGIGRLLANRQAHLAAPWLALSGRPYEFRFACRPGAGVPGRLAIAAIGWALATTPVPVPPFGWFELSPAALTDLPWIPLDPTTGEGTCTFHVPGSPLLLGQFFAVQALLVDTVGGGSHLTAAVTDIVRW